MYNIGIDIQGLKETVFDPSEYKKTDFEHYSTLKTFNLIAVNYIVNRMQSGESQTNLNKLVELSRSENGLIQIASYVLTNLDVPISGLEGVEVIQPQKSDT